MSGIVVLCRLCVSSRPEYKSLYDENGHGTYIYEITLRYFDPMLLSADNDQCSTVICSECWQHITDFYGFQESILETQSNLQDNQIFFQIKVEDEMIFEPQAVTLDSPDNQDLRDDNDRLGFDNLKEYISFGSDDDDKPLILQKAKQKRLKAHEKREDDTVVSNLLTRAKTARSGSKPRSSAKISKSRKSKQNTKPPLLTISSDGHQKVEENVCKNDPTMIYNSSKDKKSSRDKTREFDAFIAKWKKDLECASCTTTVANFDRLREHFNAEHPNETCRTKCCEKMFSKRFYLIEHLQLHINPETFKCNICGKCSATSRNLAKHTHDRHTEEGKRRPFGCDICRKKFTHKFTLRRHLETHESARVHICGECGKGFVTEQRRKIHERAVHDADRICDQCGKQFHGVYALKKHLQEHKGVEKSKYSCDQCGTQLTSNASLKRHKEQKHHDGTTAYICRECGKIFNSQTSLLRHKKIVHIIERKYKCSICEKGFKFPQYLREHMASHTGIDLYQCPHCPKTFKVRSNLHHHRKRVHQKEWLEARVRKLPPKKININLVSNEIVI